MVAKTSILLEHRILRALELIPSSKKMEKMIPGVLPEEIGGKDLSIIKSLLAKGCILVKEKVSYINEICPEC